MRSCYLQCGYEHYVICPHYAEEQDFPWDKYLVGVILHHGDEHDQLYS